MGSYEKNTIIFFCLLCAVARAQFDTLIFQKSGFYLADGGQNVLALGDQNNDGYADFLVSDCRDSKVYIFFGGNPVDTVPRLVINNIKVKRMAAVDVNNDGYKDLLFTTYDVYPDDPTTVKIYYGGPLLDTIPDIIFHGPPGVSNNFVVPIILDDFNGDGRSEIVFYDPNVPYSNVRQNGNYYFYNTGLQFDTIPHIILRGDTSIGERLEGSTFSSGDINGDGKTDILLYGYTGDPFDSTYNPFRRLYLGNASFDLTPAVTYRQKEHSFNTEYWRFIKDINGDGRDDILISDYGYYPWYYHYALLYGSFPVDTIPKAGINAQNLALDFENVISGKFNGDAYNDFFTRLLPGGFQQVKVWTGGRKPPSDCRKTWYGGEEGLGRSIAKVGDVNGDGLDDICIMTIRFLDPLGGRIGTPGTVSIYKGDRSVSGDTYPPSIIKTQSLQTGGYALDFSFPNPFNPTTEISYTIPVSGKVQIKVYNMLGQEICTLVDQEQPAGKYTVSFNGSALPSGTYFYTLRSGNFTATKKMLLCK